MRLFNILFIVFLSASVCCANGIAYKDVNTILPLNNEVKFLKIDEDIKIENIQKKISEFKESNGESNFGYYNGRLWLTFDAKNLTGSDVYVQIRFSTLDKISIYKVDSTGKVVWEKNIHEWDYTSRREINHPFYHFALGLKKNEQAHYFFKIESEEQIILPLKIGSQKSIYESIREVDIIFFAYLGVMLTLFVYNFFVYISIREPNYILYLLYILVMTTTQLNRHGFTTMYLWPNIPWAPNFAMSQFASLIGLSIIPFALRFLEHDWKRKVISFCVVLFSFGFLVGLCLGWLGFYSISRQFSLSSSLFGACTLIFMSLQSTKRGPSESSKYFLIGWSMYMLFVAYFILSLSGIFSYTSFTEFSPEAGAALEGVLLSFALANRINISNREKIKSQELAFEAQEKYQDLLSHQKEELVRQVKIKTLELKEANEELKRKALSAQINPHFVFNVLNSIQAFILKNERMEAYKYLSKFSKLMRFFLSSSLHKTIELEQEMKAINHYLELEKVRFGEKLHYQVRVDVPFPLENIKIPSMLILPFLENAIWHGLAPLKEGGNLHVTLNMEDDILRCVIEDDGIGYKNINKKLKEDHESAGMRITKERMQLYGENLGEDYFFSILDKSIDVGNGTGTIVQFNLPFELV